MSKSVLRVIELFAGIGSQTQALKNIGIEHEVVAISEIDKYAVKSYEALHGKPNNLGDICEIKALPKADLWTYSFPCQDISLAGKLAGIKAGTRSGLLFQVERLLKVANEQGTLPKYLLLENVKNLVGKKFKADFDSWLSFLSSLGYTNYWQVLNAKHYGIPQNRERVFCLSVRGEHKPYIFPEKKELTLKLKDLIDEVVDEKYYLSDAKLESILKSDFIQRQKRIENMDICRTICARDYKEPQCVQLGVMHGKKWDKMHEISRRVYGTDGISPTVHCQCGGNTELKIGLNLFSKKLRGGGTSKGILEPDSAESLSMNNDEKIHFKIIEDMYKSRPPRVFEETVPTLLAGRSGLKVVAGQFQPADRGYKAKGEPRREHFECRKDEVSNAVLTGDKKNCVQIAAMRGRIESAPDKAAGSNFKQWLETNDEEICNTLTSVQKNNLLIENEVSHCVRVGGHGSTDRHSWDIIAVRPTERTFHIQMATKRGYDIARSGDYVNVAYPNSKTHRGRVGKDVAQTVTCGEKSAVVTEAVRIRKLTPRECLRLMGWSDKQIDKIQGAGVSSTQQYRQAGNGIVVQVLEAIFRNLFY